MPAGSPFFASLTSSSSTCTSWSGSSASGPSGPASGGLEHISTPLSSRFVMIYEGVRALASNFGPLWTCIQGTTLCCSPCFAVSFTLLCALLHASLFASLYASLYILCLALRLTLCLAPRFTLCSISPFLEDKIDFSQVLRQLVRLRAHPGGPGGHLHHRPHGHRRLRGAEHHHVEALPGHQAAWAWSAWR